jgi:hypothetical protein
MIDDTMSLAWVGIALGRPTSKVQSRLPFLSLIQSGEILSSFMHVDEKCFELAGARRLAQLAQGLGLGK